MKTLSPVIAGLSKREQEELKEPLKFSPEDIAKITIELVGYPFVAFGNALVCPSCGVQQGVLTNVAPDGEVNFYLNFRCEHYKKLEQAKIAKLGEAASTTDSPVATPVEEDPQQNQQ